MTRRRITLYYDDEVDRGLTEFLERLKPYRRSERLRDILLLGIEAEKNGMELMDLRSGAASTVELNQSESKPEAGSGAKPLWNEGTRRSPGSANASDEEFVLPEREALSAPTEPESSGPRRTVYRFEPTQDD